MCKAQQLLESRTSQLREIHQANYNRTKVGDHIKVLCRIGRDERVASGIVIGKIIRTLYIATDKHCQNWFGSGNGLITEAKTNHLGCSARFIGKPYGISTFGSSDAIIQVNNTWKCPNVTKG